VAQVPRNSPFLTNSRRTDIKRKKAPKMPMVSRKTAMGITDYCEGKNTTVNPHPKFQHHG